MDNQKKIILGLLALGAGAYAYKNRDGLKEAASNGINGLDITVRPEKIIDSVEPWVLNGMNPQTKELLFNASKRFVNGYFTSHLNLEE